MTQIGDRVARGSLAASKIQQQPNGRPNWHGWITTEAPLPAGTKLRIAAWSRENPDGAAFLSLIVSTSPTEGRGRK